jgi:hypothetical protein
MIVVIFNGDSQTVLWARHSWSESGNISCNQTNAIFILKFSTHANSTVS